MFLHWFDVGSVTFKRVKNEKLEGAAVELAAGYCSTEARLQGFLRHLLSDISPHTSAFSQSLSQNPTH